MSLFRERRAELDQAGASLALTNNFRSAPAVLEVVNSLFSGRFDRFTPLVPARESGPAEPAGPRVELLLTRPDGWGERPAGRPSSRAACRPRGGGATPRRARWPRASRSSSPWTGSRRETSSSFFGPPATCASTSARCSGAGVPTLAAVGAFWEHQQVGDLLAYLRALANPLDELALYGVLASPLVGLSSDALALLARAARERGDPLWRVASSSSPAARRWASRPWTPRRSPASARRCRRERASAPLARSSELIERAVRGRSYREHVLGLEGGERRIANIHKLLRLARRFEAAEGRDLRGFLDHVEHLASSAGAREAEAPVDGAEAHAVRLMSIHAAKGLEFPVVCVADLGRAPNTMIADLLVDGERVGLRLARLDGERATPELEFDELAGERAAGSLRRRTASCTWR